MNDVLDDLRAAADYQIRMSGSASDYLLEAENEIKRLRADLATQQGCCDGAAAQDAHIRREREEHRAEVERLKGLLSTLSRDMSEEIESLRRQKKAAEWIASAGAAQRRAEIERLTRERDEARAVVSTLEIVGKAADDKLARMQEEIERLHKAHETACLGGSHD